MKRTTKAISTGHPLVSVIMPVRNGRHFIELAVKSIIKQTTRDFELIIVDDESTDDTWKIIQKLQKQYPQYIRSFKLAKNKGIFGATNYALRRSRGKFIALMDSDDIAHPTRLEKQVKYLLDNKDVIVVGSQVNVINEKGEITGQKKVPTSYEKIYKTFAIFHPMVHPSCMVRRNLPNGKKFKYTDKFGVNDDYNTFFSILKVGKFINLEESLLNYRIHSSNNSMIDVRKKFLNSIKVRIEAYHKHAYQYSILDIFLILLQIIAVFSIPQKYIFTTYMICRDVYFNIKSNTAYKALNIIYFKISRNYIPNLRSILL